MNFFITNQCNQKILRRVDLVLRASGLWVVIASLQCCQCRSLFLNAALLEAQEDWQYVRPHSADGRHFLFYFRHDTSECVAKRCIIEPSEIEDCAYLLQGRRRTGPPF